MIVREATPGTRLALLTKLTKQDIGYNDLPRLSEKRV